MVARQFTVLVSLISADIPVVLPVRDQMVVELGYLKSYEHMGRAAVSCEGGCGCAPWTLDGHHEQRNSQTFLAQFKATQADECVILVKVLNVGGGGGGGAWGNGSALSWSGAQREWWWGTLGQGAWVKGRSRQLG